MGYFGIFIITVIVNKQPWMGAIHTGLDGYFHSYYPYLFMYMNPR